VYSPTILLQGAGVSDVIVTALTAVVGVLALSGAVSGYFFAAATWAERAVLAVAAVVLIFHDVRADAIGGVLLVLVALVQVARRRSAAPTAGRSP
jgi:TRAP-type uncharacterized transport system fused permease subunit